MASKLKIKVNGLVHNVTASLVRHRSYAIARTPLLYVLHNELRQLERVRRALGGTRRRCATYCAERRSRVCRAVTLPALLATHLIALGPGYGEHNWYLPGSNGSPALDVEGHP
jgi:hypothetical protein